MREIIYLPLTTAPGNTRLPDLKKANNLQEIHTLTCQEVEISLSPERFRLYSSED